MFKDACKKNREAIYGIRSWTRISKNELSNGMGSGFAIAPGIIAIAGHLVHINNDPKNKIHSNFHIIRSPDIDQRAEVATFIAEDPNQDIALLKLDSPRSTEFLTLEPNQVPTGTSCGSLGFPLGTLTQIAEGMKLGLIERFQGSYISSFRQALSPKGKVVDYYEIDSEMYAGSSGCPGFLVNSNVIGMQSQSLSSGQSVVNRPKRIKGGKKVLRDTQLAISMWVPSMDIIKFARDNGITV